MIICSQCKKILDPGNPAKTEEKLCLKCVQSEHSHMILDFNKKPEPINGKDPKQNIKTEFAYAKMDYRYFLEIIITPQVDIKKNAPITIGIPRSQLEIFIEEMKKLRKIDKDA